MTDTTEQPSWKKYEHHPGPCPKQEHAAFVASRDKRVASAQGGGNMMFGTPRKAKCRDSKVNGVRIK